MNRYYYLLRPPGIGCQPKGFERFAGFYHRTFVPEIGREAWGWVEYAEPLTQRQIDDYELMGVQND